MDGIILISAGASLAVLVAFGLIGHQQKKKAEAKVAKITGEVLRQNPHAEILGEISYHGGFPPRPKPSILQLGLTADSLLLYDYKGWSGKVYFQDWCGLEQFTILVKADTTGKSTVMLGPLVPYLFKDTLRHFIAVKYKDLDREENHLLLETKSKTLQQQIYDRLFYRGKKCEL